MAPDPFECYELCVQSPGTLVTFLRAVHGQRATVLREDFCGSAALSRRWILEGLKAGEVWRATGVDVDADALARAADGARAAGVEDAIEFRRADAVHTQIETTDGCDIVFVGNFSLGYIHRRADLLAYLRASRRRLALGNAGLGGGVFVCDTYGGASAYKPGMLRRTQPARRHGIIHYIWVHESADPITGIVENSISFQFEVDGEIVRELPRAFTYRWRLWSVHEIREAMLEAGFVSVDVYKDLNVAPHQPARPVRSPAELTADGADDWVVAIAGRTEA
ncbi:MAG: hypothetical protein SFY69_07035 [Planctomycetota bacterium]|nr:hypothetical protein [Planctomycetota bacterium]